MPAHKKVTQSFSLVSLLVYVLFVLFDLFLSTDHNSANVLNLHDVLCYLIWFLLPRQLFFLMGTMAADHLQRMTNDGMTSIASVSNSFGL